MNRRVGVSAGVEHLAGRPTRIMAGNQYRANRSHASTRGGMEDVPHLVTDFDSSNQSGDSRMTDRVASNNHNHKFGHITVIQTVVIGLTALRGSLSLSLLTIS
jgi:hypothetical protein